MATASSSFTTLQADSITSANPGVVTTSTSHNWQTGDVVGFQALTTMIELNGTNAVITVLSSTTFSIGDTSSFSADSTAAADTVFLVVDISGYLKTGAKGEDVTVAISGTYTSTVHLERAI